MAEREKHRSGAYRREAPPSETAAPAEDGRPRLAGAGEAGAFLIPYFATHRQEALYIVGLDGEYTFLGLRLAALGGADSVRVELEDMVRMSEAMCAVYVIAAHNHPSGIALPSAADERATLRFRDALREKNITLLDHIVVSGDDFVSLWENGVLT